MATITSYDTKAGKRWRVRYRKPDRSQTDKRGFKTKRDAQAFAATVEVQKLSGSYISPTDARITVASLAEPWLRTKQATLKPSSYQSLHTAWNARVEEAWGDRAIGTIRKSEVQAWLDGIDKSATVVRRAHEVLAGILDTALNDRLIPANPARGVKLPRKNRKANVYLTHAQVNALAEAAPADKRALVLTLAYTGLRWGEATALRVQSVTDVPRRLHVTENAVTVAGLIHMGTPKTHEKRTVPYPEFLADDLKKLSEGKTRAAFLFGDGATVLPYPRSNGGWFSNAVNRVHKKDPAFPIVTIHDLRHTTASLAISAGANVKVVQRMLGHASAAMTLDIYSDLIVDDLDTVADRLNDARKTVG